MHPRGLFEVLVSCEKDLDNLDIKKHIVRIRGTVGNRKKRLLVKKAKEFKLEITNPGIDLMQKVKEDKKKEPAKKEETKTVQEPKETKDNKEKTAAEQPKVTKEKEESRQEEKHAQHKPESKKPPVDKKTAKPTKFEASNLRSRKNKDN